MQVDGDERRALEGVLGCDVDEAASGAGDQIADSWPERWLGITVFSAWVAEPAEAS
jgi:hypothetical protein